MNLLFRLNIPRMAPFLSMVFSVLFLGLVVFFDWKFAVLIEKKAESLAEAKLVIAGFEYKRAALSREKDYINEAEEDIKNIYSAFIDKENPIAFIEKLERFAKSLNVKLRLSLPEKRVDTLAFKIEAIGRFSDVLSLLGGIEIFREQGVLENLTFELLSGFTEGAAIGKKSAVQVKAAAQFEFLAK